MSYRNYPIFRVLIFLVLGIIIAKMHVFSYVTPFVALIVSLYLCIISSVIYFKTAYNLQWIAGLVLLCAALFLGFGVTKYRLSSSCSPAVKDYLLQHRHYVMTIIEQPEVRSKSVKMKVMIEKSLSDSSVLQPCMLYMAQDSASLKLSYGDMILADCQLKEIEPPKNPDAFDYRDYMHRKGIYFTGYVSQGHWQKVGGGHGRWLKALSYRAQQYFSKQFAQAGVVGDEYAVITAILLGNDETMEPDLRARYASAGVSHILCVSGMHVGIIYMILGFLLRPLNSYRRTRYFKSCLLVVCIWLYAHITGLSPSVTRAATMFTFVSLGELLRRNTNVFHSLYASLFILLIINPLLLFEIGFQLSYLAVFGIVIFQPMIVSWLKPQTKIGKYFNELASVSLAAQLTTFPVSVFNFGQFPNYFLFANLSVIALSFIVVVSGVLLQAVSFCPLLARWVGYVLGLEIKGMNYIISGINDLPGAVSENIKLDELQVYMIYLLILLLVIFIKTKRKAVLWIFLSLFLLLPLTFLYDKVLQAQKVEMTVYSVQRNTALGFYDGNGGILLADTAMWYKSSGYSYNISSHEREIRRLSRPLALCDSHFVKGAFVKKGSFVYFHNTTLFLLERGKWLYPTVRPPEVDYLVLCHSPQMNPEKVERCVRFRHVIIDGSNTPYYREKWLQYCRKHRIELYNVADNGAMQLVRFEKTHKLVALKK